MSSTVNDIVIIPDNVDTAEYTTHSEESAKFRDIVLTTVILLSTYELMLGVQLHSAEIAAYLNKSYVDETLILNVAKYIEWVTYNVGMYVGVGYTATMFIGNYLYPSGIESYRSDRTQS